jgi:hypothetical protein
MRKSLVAFLLLAILTTSAIPLFSRVSAATTSYAIDPPSLVDEALTPCNNITVTVEVLNVTDLFGYEFRLYYKKVLNATSVVRPPGQFLEPILSPMNRFVAKWEVMNDYNATHGRIWLAYTLLAPETPRTGSGALAEITFHIEDVDSTYIAFSDSKLADGVGDPIPHDTQAGYFSNAPLPEPPPPAEVYVDPEELIDEALIPCHNFTVDVNVVNATDVYAFEFKVGYDPAIIEALEVLEGSFLSDLGATSILGTEINNTAGYLWLSVTLTSPPPASGNGTLATITFHVLDYGASLLTLYDTSLTDSASQPLTHTTKNGFFSNVIFAKLFVEPPEIIDPSILPGDIFSIEIRIENVQDLYGYRFHLAYNTGVLTCIGVQIHPVLNETRFTNNFAVNDGIGDIFVNVTYYPPANSISTIPPLTLVTLTFKVDAIGTSNLTLQDTELVDPTGDPIPHETEDGFFQSVIRDVAVIDVVPSAAMVYEGWMLNVTVIVKNEGNVSETFDVTASYDSTAIATLTVTGLLPGENETLIFEMSTNGLVPCANYTITAEADSVPFETDLADNIYVSSLQIKIKLLGDVNNDSVVDIFDLAAAALAFGAVPGDPNWNPETDFDQNELIDIFDIVQITINFGRTC